MTRVMKFLVEILRFGLVLMLSEVGVGNGHGRERGRSVSLLLT